MEARDVSMHLKPLRTQFENLEECEYLELPLRFPAMFHVVCLIWANSAHYRHPARLVVLLQEVSNLVINMVRTCVHACVVCMLRVCTCTCSSRSELLPNHLEKGRLLLV